MDSCTRRLPTPTHAGGRPTKSLWRETTETTWHLVIVGLAVPAVASRVARSRRLSALAVTTLVVGAAWHVTVSLADRIATPAAQPS